MTDEEQKFMKLGKIIVGMINDLQKQSGGETAYSHRTLSFIGGQVEVFIVNDKALVELFDRAANGEYEITEATPGSQLN